MNKNFRALILYNDKSYSFKKINKSDNTFEANNSTYLVNQDAIFLDRKKGKKRLSIYSKDNIFPYGDTNRIHADDVIDKVNKKSRLKKLEQKKDLTENETKEYKELKEITSDTTIGDRQFQILLHVKGLRDFLTNPKTDYMMFLMIAGLSMFVGIIIGLAIGQVKL